MTDKYKNKSREYFDKLAGRYASSYEGRHAEDLYGTVLQKLNTFSFCSILDIGCGTGELLSLISKREGVTLSGIDISPEMIRIAREKLGKGSDIRLGDSEELPWKDNSFDVVMCIDAFHHYPHPQKALSEMHRVIRPEGHLIIADPWHPSPVRQLQNLFIQIWVRSRRGDVRFYSESEIRRLLEECQFEPIEWERAGRLLTAISAYVVTARPSK